MRRLLSGAREVVVSKCIGNTSTGFSIGHVADVEAASQLVFITTLLTLAHLFEST